MWGNNVKNFISSWFASRNIRLFSAGGDAIIADGDGASGEGGNAMADAVPASSGGEVLSRGMSTATTIPASEDELRTFMASCFHLHGQFFQSENLPQKVQRHHGISHETTT